MARKKVDNALIPWLGFRKGDENERRCNVEIT